MISITGDRIRIVITSEIYQAPAVTKNKTFSIFHTEAFAEDFAPKSSQNGFQGSWMEGQHSPVGHLDLDRKGNGVDYGHGHQLDLSDPLDSVSQRGEKAMKKINRDLIDMYIEDNKALVKRMFGEYESPENEHSPTDGHHSYSTYDGTPMDRASPGHGSRRAKRAYGKYGTDNSRTDSCESAVEIVTPYWASNSAGKIRAIVNTQHLQQAIQQEVCHPALIKGSLGCAI
ncbi:hypothetical protein HDE_02113 [Halotydeus destructor]|nr:hypothetical protein HDE_02113 [Halotydeus destructor]